MAAVLDHQPPLRAERPVIAPSDHLIADRLGHGSNRTVLDVYGHLYEGIDQAAMEGLDRLRSQAATDTRPFERRVDGNRIQESSVPVRVFGGGR